MFPPGIAAARELRALIFDWAGTTVDFGSLAPVRTLQKVFEQFGLKLSEAQARRDMGLPKREHVARILAEAEVRAAWKDANGRPPSEADTERVYRDFEPLQLACLEEYAAVITGVPRAVELARARGLRIGSTTGYTRAMLDVLLGAAARQGYAPDCSVSPDGPGAGRPLPFMIFENAIRMQVYPPAAIVKIGDTVADIEEGLNAGAWSIGVAATGNLVGFCEADFDALSGSERGERLAHARRTLEQAGAHYVIDTLADLEPVLDDIDDRLGASAPTA